MALKKKPLSFAITEFERYAYQKNYQKFEKCLIELCDYLDKSGPIEEEHVIDDNGKLVEIKSGLHPLNDQMSLDQKKDQYSRLAAAITAYLSDTGITHTNEVLIHLVIFKAIFSNIFYLSCYGNMDHILWNRNLMENGFALNLKTDQDIKYLIVCYTLNSQINIKYDLLLKALPLFGTYGYLGLLYGAHHSYNNNIYGNLKKLIAEHKNIEAFSLDTTLVELMGNPWMGCSYFDVEHPHRLKISMNVALERWIQKQISPGLKKRIKHYIAECEDVKRVVILSEQYTANHAMYRCYHQPISELRSLYELVLVTAPKSYDQVSAKDFDQIIEVKDSAEDIVKTVTKIAKLKPDLIIYPSLGMAKWTVALVNLRLARYQIMGYGHPASAFAKTIDCGVTSSLPEGNDYQQFTLEKVLPYHHSHLYLHPHPEYVSQLRNKPDDGIVRIAINSSLPKINNRLINLCTIIQANSNVPLEFHFFLVSKMNCENQAFEKSLIERIGRNCRVHGSTHYKKYMDNLSKCDLAIGTFPFGGANTNVDLLLLGIPKIYYTEGTGIASYADSIFFNKFDLPEVLCAQSEADMMAKIIYLVHNANERERISKLILDSNPYNTLFNEEYKDDEHLFVQAIDWVLNKGGPK